MSSNLRPIRDDNGRLAGMLENVLDQCDAAKAANERHFAAQDLAIARVCIEAMSTAGSGNGILGVPPDSEEMRRAIEQGRAFYEYLHRRLRDADPPAGA